MTFAHFFEGLVVGTCQFGIALTLFCGWLVIGLCLLYDARGAVPEEVAVRWFGAIMVTWIAALMAFGLGYAITQYWLAY